MVVQARKKIIIDFFIFREIYPPFFYLNDIYMHIYFTITCTFDLEKNIHSEEEGIYQHYSEKKIMWSLI